MSNTHEKLKNRKKHLLGLIHSESEKDCLGQGWKRDATGKPFFWYGVRWNNYDAAIDNQHNFGIQHGGKGPYKDGWQISDLEIEPDAPLQPQAIDRAWSMKSSPYSISNFCEETNPSVSIKEVFEEIRAKNMEYMEYQDERAHSVIALDILATYWDAVWDSRGRTYFSALYDSGKTKQMCIYQELVHKPLMSINASGAAIFRATHSNYNTVLVDDFDSLNDEQKTDLIQMMKGHYGESKILRCVGQNHEVQGFRIGPMVVNNTVGLDKITISRFKMLKIPSSSNKAIRKKTVSPKDRGWIPLRDKLHCMGLSCFDQVFKEMEEFDCDFLSGRELERVKGVLVLAKAVSPELYKEVGSFIQESDLENRSEVIQESEEYAIMRYIVQELEHIKVPIVREVRSIVDAIEENLLVGDGGFRESSKYQSLKYGLSRRIGQMLKSSGYFPYKSHAGKAAYEFSRSSVKLFCEARGFHDLIKEWEQEVVESKVDVEKGERL